MKSSKLMVLAVLVSGSGGAFARSGPHPLHVYGSGDWFAYTLMSDGTVYGNGYNFGQVGLGSNVNVATPTKVMACRSASGQFLGTLDAVGCQAAGGTWGDLTQVTALGVGQNHTLALLDGGKDGPHGAVVDWGLNFDGQLGNGAYEVFHGTAVQVQCGEMAGTPWCATDGTLQGVVAVAAGGAKAGGTGHSLALLSDGSVLAWGYGDFGQLGNGHFLVDAATPVRVLCGDVHDGAHCSEDGHLTRVVAIGASAGSSYAILGDGRLVSWGWNLKGWLGDGTTISRATPGFVACGELEGTSSCDEAGHLTGVTAIGRNVTSGAVSVLLGDGTVASMGVSGGGQLGNGSAAESDVPVRVLCGDVDPEHCNSLGDLSDVVAVAVGSTFRLALLNDGTVAAWGLNSTGALGDGTTQTRFAPVAVKGLSDVVDIAAGYDDAHALLANGTVIGWGDDNTDQAGFETTAGGRSTPVAVEDLESVDAVSAGGNFSLALQTGAALYGWGDGNEGQLIGNPTSATPHQLHFPDSAMVAELATGFDYALARMSDGTVYAWGTNGRGQLGIGNDKLGLNFDTPMPVGGLSGITAIATFPSGTHVLAIGAGGAVWAWGANAGNDLGYDTGGADSGTPGRVSCGALAGTSFCDSGGLVGATAVAASKDGSFALLSDGTVVDWGGGQAAPEVVSISGDVVAIHGVGGEGGLALLADGTVAAWTVGDTTGQRRPDLSGLDVVQLAGGNSFGLVRTADGHAYTWGGNGVGQLGDGSNGSSDTAVQVLGCYRASGELVGTPYNDSCANIGGTLSPLAGVVSVSAGYDHGLALLDDGTVVAWGDMVDGILGNGLLGPFYDVPTVQIALGKAGGPRITPLVGSALVIASESVVTGDLPGQAKDQLVLGPGVRVTGAITGFGQVTADGQGIEVSNDTSVDNLLLRAGAMMTVKGDLGFTTSLILHGSSSATIFEDLECPSGATYLADPSATLTVRDAIDCPAVEAP